MKNWTDDSRDDYETEEQWIEAYPDNPCLNCGQPGVLAGTICFTCGVIGIPF